ncbi:MAG: gephyrin-like molybdotransferase Glp [Arhodomonas sp.]|nr:gephyrin-like molybdotransferase Glp [Arhodomonas sp.]
MSASGPIGGGHDSPAITLDEALARIRGALMPATLIERVPVRCALGRVLAETVTADRDVPLRDNSAMDEDALRHADALAGPLRIIGDALAGHPYGSAVGPGECVRIMTGGVVPAGADTVVMQEHCAADGDHLRIERCPDPGANIRRAGEDLPRGGTVLEAGRRLTAADLGVLASVGRAEADVRYRPRVAFFSTGDELRSVGQPLGEGDVYDSNRYTLHGMLSRLGVEAVDLGVVRDDPEDLRRALNEAAHRADVILTSGGVSVGSADYVTTVLSEIGEIGFWRVSVKPGRPLAFGHIGGAAFFGLPGNPVSSMVTFTQIVAPALRHLSGETPRPPLRFTARCTAALHKKPGLLEFQRGMLGSGTDGQPEVTPFGRQGSGILRSMSAADCFIVLPREGAEIGAGDPVTVEPFQGPLAL